MIIRIYFCADFLRTKYRYVKMVVHEAIKWRMPFFFFATSSFLHLFACPLILIPFNNKVATAKNVVEFLVIEILLFFFHENLAAI